MTRGYSIGHQEPVRYEYGPAAQYVAKTLMATEARLRLSPDLRFESEQARRALYDIAELEEGWDGYGAKAVSKAVRIYAWSALNHFAYTGVAPEISPRPNGTIAFDWRANGTRSHFEIGKTKYSMFVTTADGKTRYFQGPSTDLGEDARRSLAAAIIASKDSTSSSTPSVTTIHYTSTRGS